MPFETSDGSPFDALALAQRPADGYRFDLLAGFAYVDPVSGVRYEIPGGDASDAVQQTDLASVPSVLWGFIASYGRQSAPAIFHDHRSRLADELGRIDREAALAQRREDDRVFHAALREQGVPVLRARLMQAWVSADRERTFAGILGWLFVIQAVLGALTVIAALVLAWWHPAWLLLLVVPAIAALPWALSWPPLVPLMLVLAYSGGFFGPLVAVSIACVAVFRIVEAIVEVLAGGRVGDVFRPTAVGEGRQGQP